MLKTDLIIFMEDKTVLTVSECVQIIKDSADVILREDSDESSIRDAYSHLHDIFAGVTGILDQTTHDKEYHQSSLGKVLPASLAAGSIRDALLNRKYTIALYRAIQQAKTLFPGERINIFYPLCGPYAHLVLPLAAKFPADEISFYFLDVSEETLDGLWKVINTLGLNEYVNQVFIGDPAVHNHDNFEPFHILFTNSIQNTFYREPFLGMVSHLKKWLREGGLVIPREVLLEAYLYSETVFIEFATTGKPASLDNRDQVHKLGEIFHWDADFTPESLPVTHPDGSVQPVIIPWAKFTIPDNGFEKPYLVAHTTIHFIDDLYSELSESGCTIPRGWARDRAPLPLEPLEFFYYWGDDPQLVYTLSGQNPAQPQISRSGMPV